MNIKIRLQKLEEKLKEKAKAESSMDYVNWLLGRFHAEIDGKLDEFLKSDKHNISFEERLWG